jgi:2-polyprenyl-3-methyl-5-hydroxy-6-metoxy-1,4-benzoquinol methylase
VRETLNYWWQSYDAQVFREYSPLLFGRVCDIGCGFGPISLLVAKDNAVEHVMGIDINWQAIELAKKYTKFIKMEHKVTFKQINFASRNIDLPSEHFDSAMTFHTLEHIYQDDLYYFMKNLYRIMKMGAPILVSIPWDHQYGSNEHVSFFTDITLGRLFNDYGFETTSIKHDTSARHLLNAVFKKSTTKEGYEL